MLSYSTPTTPFAHQSEAIALSLYREEFAYLMEQGTGKSYIVLMRAARMFAEGRLNSLVVVAPNGLHRDWLTKQFAVHWPPELPIASAYYAAGGRVAEKRAVEGLFHIPFSIFVVLTVNTEAIARVKGAQDAIVRILRRGKSMLCLDECDDFKTPSAKQSRTAQRLAKYATYRTMGTGTEITQSPLDLYAQFQCLRPGALGCENYAVFKARYAEWEEKYIGQPDPLTGKRKSYPSLVRYRNLEELKARVSSFSYQKLKKDCLDLPEKIYQTIPVFLAPRQRAQYDLIVNRVLAEFANGEVLTANALTKCLRLAQVCGGFLPLMKDYEAAGEPTDGNAKLAALLELLPKIAETSQVIVWARFRAELAMLAEALCPFGNVSQYHGGIPDDDRPEEERKFHAGETRFMLAQQQAGGRGKTWIEATYVIYYSNDFSLRLRLQSEDRAHRIGQTKNVTCIDLIVQDSIDERTRRAHAAKKEVADFFKSPQGFISP